MTAMIWGWVPAVVLSMGAVLTLGGVQEQKSMPLRTPLHTAVPQVIGGLPGRDIVISEAERSVAGMDDYVMRMYAPEGAQDAAAAFSVYVGYYEHQSQGHSIHSPRNCLPGGGWEPLTYQRSVISTTAGELPVNRYLIGNGPQRALVLYWYQGRGRALANEYAVKWYLLRDQALHGRSDEALVRVIVPVTDTEEGAYTLAVSVARRLSSAVEQALPS